MSPNTSVGAELTCKFLTNHLAAERDLSAQTIGSTRSNCELIPPWRSRSMSSIESAPATIPPTIELIFAPR